MQPEQKRRIIFVPGKNPKPPPEAHIPQLWRSLVRGVEKADAGAAAELAARPESFSLIAWNQTYYGSTKEIDDDLPWIDRLLQRDGPNEADRREIRDWRNKFARVTYNLIDRFPVFIPLIPDPATKGAIQETQRYFDNVGEIATAVRGLLLEPLRRMFDANDRILLIGHSMGSIIAYDALWELSRLENNRGRISLFLTLGSPLGLNFAQRRLLGAGAREESRYPANIERWINVASEGDLTALDTTLHDDFADMIRLGLTESIVDLSDGVCNYFRNDKGLNVHRSYGYLVNRAVGEVIARWWRGVPLPHASGVDECA